MVVQCTYQSGLAISQSWLHGVLSLKYNQFSLHIYKICIKIILLESLENMCTKKSTVHCTKDRKILLPPIILSLKEVVADEDGNITTTAEGKSDKDKKESTTPDEEPDDGDKSGEGDGKDAGEPGLDR